SRVNTFAHVNHTHQLNRLGVLLCINGTGILNSWMHHHLTPDLDYPDMDRVASSVPIGSDGLVVMPFGNGAERVLQNKEIGCSIHGLNFNKHEAKHILRASQEGIVFSFCYGMDIMKQMGLDIQHIHAGRANMFKSALFCDTLATVSGAMIDVYKTDGADGAAKGAGMGIGIYQNHDQAFATLECIAHIEPLTAQKDEYQAAYLRWKNLLEKEL
ncbi:MAG: carbohydrate kinase, partial [Bacteroidaceae bacterium]|nr:carbohydrate kinase [Bacteroidaceae bacterium]